MRINKLILFSFYIGLLYLLLGIHDLSKYANNWDDSVHFGRGQAILHYYLTGKKDYSDLPDGAVKSFYQHNSYTYSFFEQQFEAKKFPIIGAGHPPLSDFFSSVTNLIFFQKLHLLGDVESYHLFGLLAASILVALLFYFVASEFGLFTGIVAAISLFLYPLFLGESRFNIKDIAEASFYSLTIIYFYKGVIRRSIKWIAVSSVFFAFAFGTKFNVLFVPIILSTWIFVYYFSRKKEGIKKLFLEQKKIVLSFLLYPIVGLFFFYATWPLLWPDPINRFIYNFSYYKWVALDGPIYPQYFGIFNIYTYPMQWILYTTPIVILVLSAFGIFYTLKNGWKEKNKTSLLILFWFILPIARVSFPNVVTYGGVRQIMEYIPAMAILSGIGATYLVGLLNKRLAFVKHFHLNPKITIQGIIVLAFIPTVLTILSLYPNESIYFNALIGGLKGAKQHNIPGWGNSLGSTYRQGVEWLNAHAEKGAKLATVYELRSNIPLMLVRSDIDVANIYRSMTRREGEYIIGVTHEGTYEDQYHRQYLERFLTPVYQLVVDGVPVLKIWKNDLAHTKPQYRKDEEKIENFTMTKTDGAIKFDMGKTVKLMRIHIQYNPSSCTLPDDGFFITSVSGGNWVRAGGSFENIPFSTWFKTQPAAGVLDYVFAAENARYLEAVINDKDSCLLKYPLNVELYKI